MKTREDFLLLAEVFRRELRRRTLIVLPIEVLATLIFVVLAGAVGSLWSNHFVGLELWISVFFITFFFLAVFGFGLYNEKSRESLARKCGLICSHCFRAIQARELKRVIATSNCPSCGQPVYH